MASILVYVIALVVPVLVSSQDTCAMESCLSDSYVLEDLDATATSNNHYYIGGMFGVHDYVENGYSCGPIRTRGLVNAMAFFWAIGRYRNDNDGVYVRGLAFDSFSRPEQTVNNLVSFETCRTTIPSVTPRQLIGYVGPDRSGEALATASFLKDMNRTQISHAATSAELSDKDMYPYFLRTVPSDENDVDILVDLLLELEVKYVMVIYLGDMYGKGGFWEFQERTESEDICIVHSEEIPKGASDADFDGIAERLMDKAEVRYVLLYADATNDRAILEAVARNGGTGRFTFIGTASWGDSQEVINNVYTSAGALTIALETSSTYQADVDSFWTWFNDLKPEDTWNPWFKQFWENTFNCIVGDTCNTESQSLANVVRGDTYVPYTIMAVDAIIRGTRQAAQTSCGGAQLCSDLMNQNNRGQLIHQGILTAYNSDGVHLFDNEGKLLDISYKILKVSGNTYDKVGSYRNGDLSLLDASSLKQSSSCPENPCLVCGERTTPPFIPTEPTKTEAPEITTQDWTEGGKYRFVKLPADTQFTGIYDYQEPSDDPDMTRFRLGYKWIIALGVLAGLGVIAVFVFEIYILYKLLGTRIGHQWRTMWLGQILLLAVFLSYLTLFAYLFVPTKATCGITRFGVGFCYSLIFAILLVKLMVLLTSKTTENALIPGDVDSPNYLKGIYQFLMFIFAVGVQVVIDVQWLIQVPPAAVKVTNVMDTEIWICNHYTWESQSGWSNTTLFVRTDFENHVISLVYIMFLILVTACVAMRAHGIITNHRESIFIGIASGFSIPIWIAWTLVGGLNKDGEHAAEYGDASIAFGLFLCATLVLFSMFLPKVRQLVNMGVEGIYLEDDRDTYYAGSVIMAPPSYKSRPSSVVYVNQGMYSEPVVIGNGDPTAVHLKHPGNTHPGSTYSAPVYVKRGGDSNYTGSKVLKVTPDLTGKHPSERRRPISEVGYMYGSRKARSESGGTMKRTRSLQELGAL